MKRQGDATATARNRMRSATQLGREQQQKTQQSKVPPKHLFIVVHRQLVPQLHLGSLLLGGLQTGVRWGGSGGGDGGGWASGGG